MKKLIFIAAFSLAMSGFAVAQSPFPELDKIKQIKLLESTREDVQKIFKDIDEGSFEGQYSTDNLTIRIFYSGGDCSDEGNDVWNVPEGKVTEIFVSLDESVKPKDLKINLSKLERLKRDEEADEGDDDLIYYDKEKGISYRVSEGEIEYIKFIPLEKNYPALCNNETVRQFKTDKEWFRNKLREPWVCYFPRPIANVAELSLSKNEITAYCINEQTSKTEVCAEHAEIEIATKGESTDPSDVLTYNYTISAGKIVGNGANVTWDLTGVKPGIYTITAGVDNGCGICGTTRTQTVVVKECSECQPKSPDAPTRPNAETILPSPEKPY